MAVSEYQLDTRIRRRHIPLITQQRRLRHLRSISARNITVDDADDSALVFSLHCRPDLDEFYVSETVESLNPSWKDFESSNFPEHVDTASPFICVKVWNLKEERKLLIEWVVFFSGLTFLGEQIPKEGKNYKPNTLIFGLSEGYYGCSDCYQNSYGNLSEVSNQLTLSSELANVRKSYTLSTLSRIKTVERAIKQTQAAVQKRRNSINAKLLSSQELHRLHSKQELLKIKVFVLKTELQSQQRKTLSLEKEIASQKEDVHQTRKKIGEKVEDQKKLVGQYLDLSKLYCECREKLLKTEASLSCRRKQLISDLCCIYPIVEFPDHNGFSIHQVHLPNSENLSGHDETMIAIALGYVCHMLLMVSQFLNIPLRYSIQFYGSKSCITDHISSHLPDKTREFPLYSKGKDRKYFEYGVFLLNKNVAQLRVYHGLTTRDLSATLPNLHELIESRLSANSEPYGIYIAPVIAQSCEGQPANNILQNGSLKELPALGGIPPVSAAKPIDSELEILQREMQAMLPSAHSAGSCSSLQPRKDLANSSCSLDKCLDDIRLMERTMRVEDNGSSIGPRASLKPNFLRQTSHHASFPSLVAPLQAASETPPLPDDFSLPAQLTPGVLTADSSQTNSEDEPDRAKPPQQEQQPLVWKDSIFYIPSDLPGSDPGRGEKAGVIADQFTADLSLRAEQLCSNKSSFQMQRLHSSSADSSEPRC